ncbi:MAG: NrdJb, partial [Woeseiaceae bacterium]|nr:NrdJb [Woeseiaceae bacterium]
MSRTKIDKKIVGYSVTKPVEPASAAPRQDFPREAIDGGAEVIRMHEKLERPEMLVGSTYKVKTPVSDHAMYVTINDIVLNRHTVHEQRRPFEVFINSKNMEHFQWVT